MTRNNSLTRRYEFVEPYLKHLSPRNLWIMLSNVKRKQSVFIFAHNVDVWLLKVAAAVVAAVVKASIPGLFWVTVTPCLPEASLSSVTHPFLDLLELLKLPFMSLWPLLNLPVHKHVCFVFKGGRERTVECSLNRYSAMYCGMCVCVCEGALVYVFTVQPQTYADKNKAFMCRSCQRSGLFPAHFLWNRLFAIQVDSFLGFRFSIACLFGRDEDIPFQTHFKGNAR